VTRHTLSGNAGSSRPAGNFRRQGKTSRAVTSHHTALKGDHGKAAAQGH
jgi:hypothetical protein